METAEAMCGSVAIVDHGRLVAGGRVRDLKRASARRTLRLAVDGDLPPGWLGRLPGVEGALPNAGGFELELLPAADPAAILTAVLAAGASVTRFEVVEPSLATRSCRTPRSSPAASTATEREARSTSLRPSSWRVSRCSPLSRRSACATSIGRR
jgi:hypothetical protein